MATRQIAQTQEVRESIRELLEVVRDFAKHNTLLQLHSLPFDSKEDTLEERIAFLLERLQ